MRPFEIRVPAVERGGARLPALLLSAPTGADIDRIAEICRDADIQEWTTVPRGYTRADAESFVTGTVASGSPRGTLRPSPLPPPAAPAPGQNLPAAARA